MVASANNLQIINMIEFKLSRTEASQFILFALWDERSRTCLYDEGEEVDEDCNRPQRESISKMFALTIWVGVQFQF